MKGIDALTPVGRGQCLLVLGGRGSGKSTACRDAAIAAARAGVRVAWAAVGEGGGAAELRELVEAFERADVLGSVTVVCAAGGAAGGAGAWRAAGAEVRSGLRRRGARGARATPAGTLCSSSTTPRAFPRRGTRSPRSSRRWAGTPPTATGTRGSRREACSRPPRRGSRPGDARRRRRRRRGSRRGRGGRAVLPLLRPFGRGRRGGGGARGVRGHARLRRRRGEAPLPGLAAAAAGQDVAGEGRGLADGAGGAAGGAGEGHPRSGGRRRCFCAVFSSLPPSSPSSSSPNRSRCPLVGDGRGRPKEDSFRGLLDALRGAEAQARSGPEQREQREQQLDGERGREATAAVKAACPLLLLRSRRTTMGGHRLHGMRPHRVIEEFMSITDGQAS